MANRCGMTKANIIERTEVNGIPVYFGTGVNPVNSPAQFFVAWGKDALAGGAIGTFNLDSPLEGHQWFVDEDEAEEKYQAMIKSLQANSDQESEVSTRGVRNANF